jgi:UDP-N-acetylmuramoyl-L-alanyl-D-glutamate--2,6-diaminopimelate ligase
MKLSELLEPLGLKDPEVIPDISVSDIVYDSRAVKPGVLFVAIRGFTADGHRFIPEAVTKGAVAVIGEEEARKTQGVNSLASGFQLPASVPYFPVSNSRMALAQISERFFYKPTHKLAVVGVTGTNGKTTITYLVEAILQADGKSPAVLGTINYRHQDKIFPASHTTPESYDLQKFIRQVKEEGADSIVMEVSSHALDLHRVDGIQFDVGVFTNLTPEHLDYHRDLEDYFRAKRRLFDELLIQSNKKEKTALFNFDDPWASRLASEFKETRRLLFSIDPNSKVSIFPQSYRLSLEGITAEVKSPWGELKIKSPLLGAFNLSNLLAAIGVAGSLGVSLATIEKALQDFKRVPGRLERVPNSAGLHVFVDYAHTPDALKNVIGSLRELLKKEPGRKVLVVFGCGGDRDKTKRPLMGKEVARLADRAVVTSDNPRTEDPRSILNQILPGLLSEGWREGHEFNVVVDRSEGIRRVLEQAKKGDIVLIAGKGHEDYQILGKTKIHFDDREVVQEVLKSR